MTYATVTLSSVGTSPAVNLNWIGGKPTTAVVFSSASGSASGDFFVQFTLDDSQRSSSPTWFGFSSNSYNIETGAAAHYNSSALFPGSSQGECLYVPIPGPVAGIRINSTGLASGSIIMKVVQGEGW